jgi:hypothetical protein
LLAKIDKIIAFIGNLTIKNDFNRDLADMKRIISEQKALIEDLTISKSEPTIVKLEEDILVDKVLETVRELPENE